MKKFLSMLLIATLGGFIAVFVQSLFFSDSSDSASSTNNKTVQQSTSLPSAFTHYLSDVPTTLPDFAVVAEMTVNAVVHIRAEFERPSSLYEEFGPGDLFNEFFFGPRERQQRPERERRTQGSGSGVIISEDGYVITNNHVVQDAVEIQVTLNDNSVYDASVVGTDPTTDLALLKIEGENFAYAVFGDSDKVKVGEWVLAVGNPFNLTSTVTAGIVSAKGRQINILGGGTAIESFIQTDAAVNRGNSGGALVNTNGELVGINAAIASTTGTFAGYSFAIPSNIAKKVMTDLMEFGEVQRGFLGIEIQGVNSQLARERELNVNQGVYIAAVSEDSAGDEAGLQSGDVITGIDGRQITSTASLLETVGRKRPGDRVSIEYIRNGKKRETEAVLKNIYGDESIVEAGEKNIMEALGARFESVTQNELRRLNIENGVRVSSLSDGKIASAGIREGFIITHIDREEVVNARELVALLNEKAGGGVLVEGVYPNGTRAYYGLGL
ncbi:MAG: Do family serine endopeptidase [Bacteroidota bacterium]